MSSKISLRRRLSLTRATTSRPWRSSMIKNVRVSSTIQTLTRCSLIVSSSSPSPKLTWSTLLTSAAKRTRPLRTDISARLTSQLSSMHTMVFQDSAAVKLHGHTISTLIISSLPLVSSLTSLVRLRWVPRRSLSHFCLLCKSDLI